MNKKKIFTLLVISLCFYQSGCAELNIPNTNNQIEQENFVIISGKVEDENGQPVAEAIVTVKDNNRVIGSVKSDSKGNFSVKVEKTFADSYLVEVEKKLADGSLKQAIILDSAEKKADFTGNDSLKKIRLS